MEKEILKCCFGKVFAQGVEITSIAIERHTGVASLISLYIDHQYGVWHMYDEKCQRADYTVIVGSSTHGQTHESSPFLVTYGGPHKPVMVMHNFLSTSDKPHCKCS